MFNIKFINAQLHWLQSLYSHFEGSSYFYQKAARGLKLRKSAEISKCVADDSLITKLVHLSRQTLGTEVSQRQ